MNFIILRALFEDARQQVLDNKVFRLLLILTAVPILLTFVVGFHEENISFMWGWKEINYKDLLESFGGGQGASEDLAGESIRFVQALVVNFFVGNFGLMLCIAATAFFAPKILEKGSADTLFSKPVSRMAILLSRYVAGILFVAFISALLVLGMYFGFLVNSGFNDPGFLWGALTLTYIYAMMHAFSMVVAVFTRSSTAAILLTITLYMFCGGVHNGWIGLEFHTQRERITMLRADESEDSEDEEDSNSILEALFTTTRVLHYTLPKTTDADIITEKLKRAITEKAPVVKTKDGDFLLKAPPTDFTLVEGTDAKFEDTGIEWSAGDRTDLGADHVLVRRYKRPEVEKKIGSRTRVRAQTGRDMAKLLEDELDEAGTTYESENKRVGGVRATRLTWTDPEDGMTHRNYYFHFDEWIYEFHLSGTQQQIESHEARQLRRNFMDNGNVILGNIGGKSPEAWYLDVFTWTAEWKYNILFSIGSSLAFIASMLGLAWLRLRKLDF